MKIHLIVIILFVFIASAEGAESPQDKWELTGGTSSSLLFQTVGDGGGNSTTFHINAGAGYFFEPKWEFGSNLTIDLFSPDNARGTTALIWTIGPTFNFSEGIESSFFAKTQIGFNDYSSATSHHYMMFEYDLGIGKRFPIIDRVTWTPEFEFLGHSRGTDGDFYDSAQTNYRLTLFRFSILL